MLCGGFIAPFLTALTRTCFAQRQIQGCQIMPLDKGIRVDAFSGLKPKVYDATRLQVHHVQNILGNEREPLIPHFLLLKMLLSIFQLYNIYNLQQYKLSTRPMPVQPYGCLISL